MARIRLDRVSKRYSSGALAISGLDLDIADQEFLVLLGPSGCGKSTTLNMIAGLEDISGGSLWFDDQRMNDIPVHRRDIAMVFQSYALYPHKTVFENIAFGLRMRGMAEQDLQRRVQDAAERLELTPLLGRRPAQLSGGQRQRVALGRAMVRQPAVFLMDEPLSNLDASLRVSMRAQIRHLHAEMRSTFVYVTHDQAEALTLADRIAVMRDGVIEQLGTPDDIYERPANVFVASFLGSPAINLIEGVLDTQAGLPCFRRGAVTIPLAMPLAVSGQAILLGIRPEDFAHGEPGPVFLDGNVTTLLPAGSDQYAALDVAGSVVFAQVGKDARIVEGDTLRLGLSPARLHVFDAATRRSMRP